MILTVLGTDKYPFPRALDLIEPLRASQELVIQTGHTPARDWPEARWHDFVPYERLTALMREADAIVCHAGVGTIMTVLSFGRRPVAIPRLASLGEHVDDHQLQILAKLTARGFLVPVDDDTDIAVAIKESRSGSVEWQHGGKLAKAVVAAVNRAT